MGTIEVETILQARWVAGAKREETRDRRVVQTLEVLRSGKTRS